MYTIFQLDSYKDRSTDKYQFLINDCIPTVKNYCSAYGIEYNYIKYDIDHKFTYKEKINLFIDIANNKNYKKSLFLDLDIYIAKNSPNIFNINFEHMAGCLAMNYRLQEGIDHVKECLSNQISNKEYFRLLNCSIRPNGGVILFNNEKIDDNLFAIDHIENNLFEDEVFISYKIANRNLIFSIIPDIWNNRNIDMININNSYFTHILSHSFFDNSGYDNKRNLNMKQISEILKGK